MAEGSGTSPDRGVTEALRTAIERTLSIAGDSARAGSAALTGEGATRLLDEVARRGRQAGDELARRGQDAREELARRSDEAGAGLARRGQEMARQLETLERRLAALEDTLRGRSKPEVED